MPQSPTTMPKEIVRFLWIVGFLPLVFVACIVGAGIIGLTKKVVNPTLILAPALVFLAIRQQRRDFRED